MLVFYGITYTQGGKVNSEIYQIFNNSKLITPDMKILNIQLKHPRSGNAPFFIITFEKDSDVNLILSRKSQFANSDDGKMVSYKRWYPPKETNMVAIYGIPFPSKSLNPSWVQHMFAGTGIFTPDMEIIEVQSKKPYMGGQAFLIVTLKNSEDVNKIIV